MARKIKTLLVCFLIVMLCLQLSFTKAHADVIEKLNDLREDMWNYYDAFRKIKSEEEREDIYKRWAKLAYQKITKYHEKTKGQPQADLLVAESFAVFALMAYQMRDPGLSYRSLKAAKELDSIVVLKVEEKTGKATELIEENWLTRFKKCRAVIYGFNQNVDWDKVEIELKQTYAEIPYRHESFQQAKETQEDYLNSQIRDGSKEVALLLPPGSYQLEGRGFDIYPSRFEVEELTDSIIFNITPDEYFNLRVFYCRDSIAIKIDTVVREVQVDTAFLDDTSYVYRRRPKKYEDYLFAEVETRDSLVKNISHDILKTPIEPKDLSIWKGNKQILDFDHLAFGVYELRDAEKFGITDEYTFKRFLPEGIKWDMPRNEKFKAEDIFVRSGDNYDYCIDLFKTEPTEYVTSRGKPTEYVTPKGKPTREWCREFCKKCRCRTVWDAILASAVMGTVFGLFMYTINK